MHRDEELVSGAVHTIHRRLSGVLSLIPLTMMVLLAACSDGMSPVDVLEAASMEIGIGDGSSGGFSTGGMSQLTVGDTVQLNSKLTDKRGRPVSAGSIKWSSSNSSVATVNRGGLMAAVGGGNAKIRASHGKLSATVSVSVVGAVAPEIVSIEVSPASATIAVGDSLDLEAVALTSAGALMDGVGFSWESSDAAVASVNEGRVQAKAAGSVTIVARADGKQGTAVIEVEDQPATDPADPPSESRFYVDRDHPAASDDNVGNDEAQPWRTLVHAARVVGAGDTVLVKRGRYTDGKVVLEHSGLPGQEIVISAYPGHEREAIVEGAGFVSIGHSHVVLRGMAFLHTPSYGIRFEGPTNPADPPAENITISGNYTHDTYSSGISIWGVRWGQDPGDYDNIRDVVIEGNLLELGTNGGKNEIITVANGAVNIDVRFNEIRIGDPNMTGGDEGIDFKEGVRDSRIHGNYIHNLSDKAIYIDGGSGPQDPQITNIEISGNVMTNLPSAGIVVTTEGEGDVNGIYVFNNVTYNVDGDGYLVYNHPGGDEAGGTVQNVIFMNNTAYDTGHRHSGYGGFRVNHEKATGIVFRNNVAWGNNGYDIRGESETTIENNLCRESFCEVRADPQFVGASMGNFRLLTTSPAIDRGTSDGAPSVDLDGVARPQGVAVDLGAFEVRR